MKEELYPIYLLQANEICSFKRHNNICDFDNSVIGPIKADQKRLSSQANPPVFYFTARSPLVTQRYEFHKSQFSSELQANNSYIYMLFDVHNAELSQLSEFLHSETLSLPGNTPGSKKKIGNFRI